MFLLLAVTTSTTAGKEAPSGLTLITEPAGHAGLYTARTRSQDIDPVFRFQYQIQ